MATTKKKHPTPKHLEHPSGGGGVRARADGFFSTEEKQ